MCVCVVGVDCGICVCVSGAVAVVVVVVVVVVGVFGLVGCFLLVLNFVVGCWLFPTRQEGVVRFYIGIRVCDASTPRPHPVSR